VLSGRGLCDELITRPEESYRLCCVVVCDLETSRMGAPYIYDISRLRVKDTGPSGLAQQVPVRRRKLQILPEWFPSCLMTSYQLHQLRGTSVNFQTVCTAIWRDIIWVFSIIATIMTRWVFPEWRLPRMIPKIIVWGFPKRSMKGQQNLHWINCFSSTSQ